MKGVVSLWRIAKDTPNYKADDLSGGGAKITGGRWDSKGNAVVYTATSVALATLETLVHLGQNIAIRNAFLVRVDVPLKVWNRRRTLLPEALPPTWVSEPPGSATIEAGDEWLLHTASALLAVPSVIVPEEFNVLINPAHPDAHAISASTVRQWVCDPRLK